MSLWFKEKRTWITELRMWCEIYCTVPTSYKLEDVVREGDHPQHISQETEIWKGRHKDEVVALKVPRAPHEGFDTSELKSVSTQHYPWWRVACHRSDR